MKKGIAASKGYAIGKVFIQEHEEIVITDEKVTDVGMTLSNDLIGEQGMIIRKGKKVFHRVVLK